MRKHTVFVLTVICTMLLMVACSSDSENNQDQSNDTNNTEASEVPVNKEGFPIVDEEITLSMMAPGASEAPEWKDIPTLQEYSEMTNINFDYNTPPIDDFQTNLNLAFASGDLPDIIFAAGSDNLTPGMEVDYGEQGMLLPLEDLIEAYAPNIKKLLEDRPDIEKSITTIDGHIYALPNVSAVHTSSWSGNLLWYNGQWLDALDVKELPKTTDELYELLKRFRDEDPNGNGEADEIPLLDVKMQSSRHWFLGAFGMKEWGIEEVDGDVRYTPILDEYKEYLTYMNKLYEEELLDPETFSQNDEQKRAKGQENRVGLFPDWYSYFTTGENEEEAMNNPMFYPFTSHVSDEPVVIRSPGFGRGSFAISSENPNPEASIRWVDYFYSQEGNRFFHLGPEGYLWEWADEEEDEIVMLDIPEEYDTIEDYRAKLTPDYGIPTASLTQPIEGQEMTAFDEFIKSETEEKYEPYAEVPYPLVYLTSEEQKESDSIEVDLESYVEQMEAKFITGVEPLSEWDNYVETIENMNIERYVEIYQDAYDRWVES